MADRLRVLHVEDDPDFAELTRIGLERTAVDMEVVSVYDAEAALEYVAEESVDCVVSDYDMPAIDGIELLEAVRERQLDLPFILFTGQGSEEIASDAISAGVTDYLQKEPGMDQFTILANRVANAVESARAKVTARRSQERFDRLSEVFPDLAFYIDEDFRYVDIIAGEDSPLLVEDATELIGKRIDELIPPETAQRLTHAVTATLESDEPRTIEYELEVQAGRRWFEAEVVPLDAPLDGNLTVLLVAHDVTDRRHRETHLESVHDRMSFALDATDSYIFEIDLETGKETRHGPFEAIHGVPSDSVTSTEEFLDRVVHPEDRDTVEEMELELAVAEPGRVIEFEYRTHPDTGVDRWLWASALVRDSDPNQLIGLTTDITERKAFEQELTEKSRAMDEAPIGIITTDPHQEDNPITYANQGFTSLTGYEVSEVLGRNCRFLQGEETDPEQVATMRQGIDTREPVTVELRNYRKDGTLFWNRVSIAPVRDSDGSLMAYVGFQEDVTEAKQRERELRRERERIDAIASAIPDVVVVYDENAVYRDVITAQSELLVADAESLRGAPVDEHLNQEAATAIRDAIERTIETGTIQQVEYQLETTEGDTRWFEGRSAPLPENEGTFVVLLARDATERVTREQDLRRQNERLEDLASILSHDLRNPLNVAEGNLELVKGDCDSVHIEAVERSHRRMNELIDDLLAITRNTDSSLNRTTLDLETLVSNCWSTVATRNATLRTDLSMTIDADEMRLKQLLENLVRNAIDHGGSDVSVHVGELEAERGFFVADDGPGIPPEKRDQIFEYGYSSDANGTGLGLAIVREIVEAHDWHISVAESELGGARFEIQEIEIVD